MALRLAVLRGLRRVDLDQQIVEELVAVVLAGLRERREVLGKIVGRHLGHGISPGWSNSMTELTVGGHRI